MHHKQGFAQVCYPILERLPFRIVDKLLGELVFSNSPADDPNPVKSKRNTPMPLEASSPR